jgi:L-gulonolactone oxidase
VPNEAVVAHSEEDVVAVVCGAEKRGLRVKVVGSGHSYSAIAQASNAVCVRLSARAWIERIDPHNGHVTLWAGAHLGAFCQTLVLHGLALPVLGAIVEQTVAGVICTATHGKGLTVKSLSDYVVGLRFVDGSGTVVNVTDRDEDVLNAARVSLGCLGVLTSITFACVKGFDIELRTRMVSLDHTINHLSRYQAADYFGFWWFPHTPWAMLRSSYRVALRPERAYVNAQVPKNSWRTKCIEAAYLIGRGKKPAAALMNASQCLLSTCRTHLRRDRWDIMFPCPMATRQIAMEYAVELDLAAIVLRALQALFKRYPVHAPIDVQFGDADKARLSPAHGRITCYIGIAVPRPFGCELPYRTLFRELEDLFRRYSGRPHWGKKHSLTASEFGHVYPQWNRFSAIRDLYDKHGIFTNSYLDRCLDSSDRIKNHADLTKNVI